MTQAMADVEVFLEVISASTPKHTKRQKFSRFKTALKSQYCLKENQCLLWNRNISLVHML